MFSPAFLHGGAALRGRRLRQLVLRAFWRGAIDEVGVAWRGVLLRPRGPLVVALVKANVRVDARVAAVDVLHPQIPVAWAVPAGAGRGSGAGVGRIAGLHPILGTPVRGVW